MMAIRLPFQRVRTVKLVLRVVALALATAGGIAKLVGGSNGLLIAGLLAGLVISVAAETIGEAVERSEKRRNWRIRVGACLDLTEGWPLPRAGVVSPYRLGAARSELAERFDPDGTRYVLRENDAAIAAALRAGHLALLIGDSATGKSRAAHHAALTTFEEPCLLLVPRSAGAFDELLQLDPPIDFGNEPVLVVLDDLDRFLGAGGLNLETLDRLRRRGRQVAFIATMRAAVFRQYRSEDAVARPGRDILEAPSTALIRFEEWSAEENSRAIDSIDDAVARHGILGFGLGPYLVAGPRLLERLRGGLEECPDGVALVTAAVAWRRAGAVSRVPRAFLERWHQERADSDRAARTSDSFSTALAWAVDPRGAGAPLLAEHEDGLAVHDFVLDNAADLLQVEAASDQFLPMIIDMLEDSASLLELSWNAPNDEAERALRKAIGRRFEGEPGWAEAHGRLGTLLWARSLASGNRDRVPEDVIEMLEVAAGNGVPMVAPLLADLRTRRNEVDRADAVLRTAAERGEVLAQWTLGTSLAARVDDAAPDDAAELLNEAVTWLSRAAENHWRPAAREVGLLLYRHGRLDEAEPWLRAIAEDEEDREVRDTTPLSTLAMLYLEQAETASSVRRTELEQKAAKWLTLLADEDVDGARGLLGSLHAMRAERDHRPSLYNNSEQALREAVDAGDRHALAPLGKLLLLRGDTEGGEKLLRRAGHQGDIAAQRHLGHLYRERAENAFHWRGHLDQAQRWFTEMAHNDDPDVAEEGRRELEILRDLEIRRNATRDRA